MFVNYFKDVVEIDQAYIVDSESHRYSKDRKLDEKDKTVVIEIINPEICQAKAFRFGSSKKEKVLPKINRHNIKDLTIAIDTCDTYKDLKLFA